MGRDITEGTPDNLIAKIFRDKEYDPARIVRDLGIGTLDEIELDGEHPVEVDLLTLTKEDKEKLDKVLADNKYRELHKQLWDKGKELGQVQPEAYLSRDGEVKINEDKLYPVEGSDFEKELNEFLQEDKNMLMWTVNVLHNYMAKNPKDEYRFYCYF